MQMRKMREMLKSQWYLMVHSGGFWLAFVLILAFTLSSFLGNAGRSWGENEQKIRTAVNMTVLAGSRAKEFAGLTALVISLPFASSYITDRHYRTAAYLLSRGNRADYLRAKLTMCFIGGALLVLIPLLMDAVLCAAAFPNNGNYLFGEEGTANYAGFLTGANQTYRSVSPAIWFLRLFLISPWLYCLLYILLFSVFAGGMSMVVFAVSCWLPVHKIFLIFPAGAILFLLRAADEHLFFQAMGDSGTTYVNLSVVDYFLPFSRGGQSPWVLLGVVLSAVVFCGISLRHLQNKEQIG